MSSFPNISTYEVKQPSASLPPEPQQQEVQKDQNPTSLIDQKLESLSKSIDEKLKENEIDFERLQAMVYSVIMLMMRRAAKTDQEYISEMNVQIKAKSVETQGTYNTWPAVTITVVSAVISIGGGAAGLTPLLPASFVSPQTAQVLSTAAQPLGYAGTGLGGIGSLFNSRSEGIRGVLQIDLKRIESKQEDKKSAKHGNNETKNAAKNNWAELNRTVHDVYIKVMS